MTIPRGATLSDAVDSLASRGLVRARASFAVYARLRGLASALKSGVYALPRDAGWGEIVRTLKRGRGTMVRFTVREGLMLTEIADLAARQLGVPRDSFRAAAEDPLLLRDLGLSAYASSAEGYLYPTTYTMRLNPTGRELVRLMTDQFRALWSRAWQARLDTLRMSRHELVTLASIIQSEVRYAPDRDYVSAVYHNRL
ncbi:MAG: endolytic transglycosylase MltG, partial [Gemmatimonadales bacterium]